MKHTLLITLLALLLSTTTRSQTTDGNDSISPAHTAGVEIIHGELPWTGTNNYDEFLLDMSLMQINTPNLTDFKLEIPDASKDYSRIFRLNSNITYSQGSPGFYLSSSVYGWNSWGFDNYTGNLQMGTFHLKNGMTLHTYGEYDKDGWKVRNPSALPWQRNNFRGAFELKSANGSFGVRIEVQQGRQIPY